MRTDKQFLYQVGLALKPFAKVAKAMREERRRALTRQDRLLLSDFERAEKLLLRLDGLVSDDINGTDNREKPL